MKMAGKRNKHATERSSKANTKRALGGGKRESNAGPRDERGKSAEYQRTGQHIPSGYHE